MFTKPTATVIVFEYVPWTPDPEDFPWLVIMKLRTLRVRKQILQERLHKILEERRDYIGMSRILANALTTSESLSCIVPVVTQDDEKRPARRY